MSNRWRTDSRLSGMTNSPHTTVAAATGRLMRKTLCQPTFSTSRPPTTGPPAMAAAEAELHMPTARFSSSGGKAARIRATVLGSRRPPNTPWTVLMAMIPPTLPMTATPSDERAKPTTPIMKTRRRP